MKMLPLRVLVLKKSFLNTVSDISALKMVLAAGLLCAAIVLLFPVPQNPELMFLDVSQGDGVLITTAEGTVILSDCGSSDVKNLAEYRLSPVLKQKGILMIDMAVVSHLDNDHISGIREVLQDMPIYDSEAAFAAGYSGAIGIKELILLPVFL